MTQLKNTLTLTLILCLQLNTFGQLSETFRDDFDNNKNRWTLKSNASSAASIKNGLLNMQHKRKSGWYVYFCDAHLNPKSDFYIETKIKQTAGPQKDAFGLIWGASSWKDSYYFEVSAAGWYRIYKYQKSKYSEIKKSDWSTKIKKGKLFNTIAVERKNGKLNYYINGSKVHSTANMPPLGKYIGFSLGKEISISADYLSVKQKKAGINLLTGGVSKFSKKIWGQQ